MSYLRYLCLFAHSGVYGFFVCLFVCLSMCLVFPMLIVSLYCPSVFSNVYFIAAIIHFSFFFIFLN